MSTSESNEKNIQIILERSLGILAQDYPVKKLDAGEFARPVTMNTQFINEHYEIEGLGHLMTMRTEGNPMMQMVTVTLMPSCKALPMISSDFMYSGEGGMALVEAYELAENREDPQFKALLSELKETFGSLPQIPDIPTQPSFFDAVRPIFFYKTRVPQYDTDCIEILADTLKIFAKYEKQMPLLSEEAKAAQAKIQHDYVEEFINQNGVSTQVWVKEHGAEYVKEFYHTVFFGV